MNKVIKKLAMVFLLLVMCFYTGLINVVYAFTVYPLLERPYHAEQWLRADPIERGYMLDSLMASEQQFAVYDKDMLISQLGAPDADRGRVICYDIGPLEGRFGFMAFPHHLCISLKGSYFDGFYITD